MRKQLLEQPNHVTDVAAVDMDKMLTADPGIYILDVRSKDEFNNQSKMMVHLNIGHIKNAVNIPSAELHNKLGELDAYKN